METPRPKRVARRTRQRVPDAIAAVDIPKPPPPSADDGGTAELVTNLPPNAPTTNEEETDSIPTGGRGAEGGEVAPMELEDGMANEGEPAGSAKSKKKRGVKLLLAEAGKWNEREDKVKKRLGIEKFDHLVGSRGWRNKRMAEEQRKERLEGKMSGITLSLPKSFSDLQAVAKQQAVTVKKLRSHVGLPQDSHHSTLKEASFIIDFMMDDRAAKERERLSKEHDILFSVDSSLLDSVSEFVAASGRSPQTRQQAGGEDELDLLLAQLAKPAKLEIPTALLFVGVNVPDHDRMFGQLAQSLRSSGQRVASLRSKDCKMMLKPIIKSLVVQLIGTNSSISLKEGKATMRALQYWYKTKGWLHDAPAAESASLEPVAECMATESKSDGYEPPLVVVIEDFEAFDADVLKELISIISYYQADMPFVLVLGLATSADALHRMLPRSVSGRLATRKFTFHSSSESFEEIFREVVIHNDTGVHFGYKMVEWLLDSFYSMHLSIQSLQRELTLATIEHFWSSHLSFLCRSQNDDDFYSSVGEHLSAVHLEHIQRTKSVSKELRQLCATDTRPSPDMLDKFKALKARRRALQAKQAEIVARPVVTQRLADDQSDVPVEQEMAEGPDAAEQATPPVTVKTEQEEEEEQDHGGEMDMEVETEVEPQMEAKDEPSVLQEMEDYNLEEITEAELLEIDPDYLRTKTAVWLDDIRRLHRNSHVLRECALILLTLEGRPADEATRKEVFRHCLPTPDFFRMLSGNAPALRLDKFVLPVRSAFVNSRLFLSAVHTVKNPIMELTPLAQLLRDFHTILSAAEDFQPFDYDPADEIVSTGMPTAEPAAPARRIHRNWVQNKQLLLADIERLRERLQARIDALNKQSNEPTTPSTSAISTPLRRSSSYVPPSPFAQTSPYTPRTHTLKRGASSKRIAAWMESWTDDIEQQLKQDLQVFLIRFFSSQLPAYCVFPLYEVFYYNTTDALEECFNAAPLTTVKRALNQPDVYLGFSDLSWPTERIDTAIAYELYKGQGKAINLKDWFDAFCELIKPDLFVPVSSSEQSESESEKPAKRPKTARTARKSVAATPARKRGASKAKQGAGDDYEDGTATDEKTPTTPSRRLRGTKRTAKRATTVMVRPDASDNEQAALLSRFLTAIGELQMLGFMCPPQGARRKEILLKMPLGGRTA